MNQRSAQGARGMIMPETKTVTISIVIFLLTMFISLLLIDRFTMVTEQTEKDINQSWDDGWYVGYEWGAYDIFEETMLTGMYYYNQTWTLYSPMGCLAAIQNDGCEVRCP